MARAASSPRTLITALILVAIPLLAGCSGILLLAQYLGAYSTIKAIFDKDDTSYLLAGHVFVDDEGTRIAISSQPTPPEAGYQAYADALLMIDTLPPRTTRSRSDGYFEFTRVRTSRVVLTVYAPDGSQVRFSVRLDGGAIEPLNR